MEKFSASQAEKFMHCRASANLDVAIPNWVPPEEDPLADTAANRGTKMHELFAEANHLSTRDMWNMGQALKYTAALRQTRKFHVLVETSVKVDWLVTKPWTTADLVLYVADEIHVIDLKTGKIPVSAVENAQLLYYAASYGYLAPRAKGVHLHIVQPWADVMESWFADTIRIVDFMREAKAVEQDILNGVTTFTPGDHCTFCPANPQGRGSRGRPYCPVLMQIHYPQPEPDYEAMMRME